VIEIVVSSQKFGGAIPLQMAPSTSNIPPHQYDTRETPFNNFDVGGVFSQKNNGPPGEAISG
jgi:hypothetical protein